MKSVDCLVSCPTQCAIDIPQHPPSIAHIKSSSKSSGLNPIGQKKETDSSYAFCKCKIVTSLFFATLAFTLGYVAFWKLSEYVATVELNNRLAPLKRDPVYLFRRAIDCGSFMYSQDL